MVELSTQRQLSNGNKAVAVVNDDGTAIGGGGSLSLVDDGTVDADLGAVPAGYYSGTTTKAVSTTNRLPVTLGSGDEVALGPGEEHIGSVGMNVTTVYLNPTTGAALHQAGDVICAQQTLTNWSRVAGLGSQALSMTLRWNEASPPSVLDFIFYRTDPSTTFADGDAFTWGTSNVDLGAAFAFHVRVTAAEWTVVGGVNVCTKLLGVGTVPTTADAYLNIVTPNALTPGVANPLFLSIQPNRD